MIEWLVRGLQRSTSGLPWSAPLWPRAAAAAAPDPAALREAHLLAQFIGLLRAEVPVGQRAGAQPGVAASSSSGSASHRPLSH